MPVAVTAEALTEDPHPVLRALREQAPVAWADELGGWLVLTRELCLQVVRDAVTFTVDDPRFSTARVVGPSMLSLDGPEHDRHRAPFARRFRLDAVGEQRVRRSLERLDRRRGADRVPLRPHRGQHDRDRPMYLPARGEGTWIRGEQP